MPSWTGEKTSGALRIQVPAQAAALAGVREEVRRWLAAAGAERDEINDLTLACSEACANAVEHPTERAQAVISLAGEVSQRTVTLIVNDDGQWRPGPPEPDRGRGLTIIGALVDSLEILPSPSGTEVRLRRRLGSA
jgi:anti-sigma regulatory factor (Ser/Thr protein kinase)